MRAGDFAVPIHQRYLADYVPESVFEYGTILVDRADVIEFARRFDPQALHTDAEAATRGPFGG